MYAIVDNKGKQYKVTAGEQVLVDLMDAEEGDKVEFDRVLLLGDLEGGEPRVGRPVVEGALVTGRVVGHEKGPKLRMAKGHKGKWVQKGHRQRYTRVEIKDISAK